ncbi:MAG: hypothetical protein J5828_00025, partial [Desulfovibrionaceae bacterium]|nr:hypothetical protein [Desulfovibrionaceae bacterium]
MKALISFMSRCFMRSSVVRLALFAPCGVKRRSLLHVLDGVVPLGRSSLVFLAWHKNCGAANEVNMPQIFIAAHIHQFLKAQDFLWLARHSS